MPTIQPSLLSESILYQVPRLLSSTSKKHSQFFSKIEIRLFLLGYITTGDRPALICARLVNEQERCENLAINAATSSFSRLCSEFTDVPCRTLPPTLSCTMLDYNEIRRLEICSLLLAGSGLTSWNALLDGALEVVQGAAVNLRNLITIWSSTLKSCTAA